SRRRGCWPARRTSGASPASRREVARSSARTGRRRAPGDRPGPARRTMREVTATDIEEDVAMPQPAMPEISVQLYAVRDALNADLEGALGRVAEIGFRNVEAFD